MRQEKSVQRLIKFLPAVIRRHFSCFPKELRQLTSYSMVGLESLNKLYLLGQDIVQRNIPGDFVECGVYNGGSAAAIALALRQSDRKVWLYDSFQGMPVSRDEVDGPDTAKYIGLYVGSEEAVSKAMKAVTFPAEKVIVRRGWFKDSFQEPLPEKVAILHIDADWHDSVTIALETFYDLVTEGGIIVLDDFGHWEGCREAFYDFINKRGLKPLLERFGYTQLFWIKNRMHNRDFKGKFEIP